MSTASTEGNDDFARLGRRFRLLPPDVQQRLFGTVARHVGAAPRGIQLRAIFDFFRADPAYGRGVARALGIDLQKELSGQGPA